MPELPEAESIRRALDRALQGAKIAQVEVFSPRMRTDLRPLLSADLPGRRITGVRRRGRYVCADLDDGRTLVMHFGMSGVVRVENFAAPRRKHEHLFLHFTDGRIFKFECTRRFSLFEVHELDSSGWPEMLSGLGPEPLTEDFNGKYLFEAAVKSRAPIKVLLMDNACVCGIGNIYASETLFAAGVRPDRRANSVSRAECDVIVREVKRILLRAIELGGTTVSDFKNVDGSEGQFVQELQIYGRRNGKCPKCGADVCEVRLGGRSSCYCPKCQH